MSVHLVPIAWGRWERPENVQSVIATQRDDKFVTRVTMADGSWVLWESTTFSDAAKHADSTASVVNGSPVVMGLSNSAIDGEAEWLSWTPAP